MELKKLERTSISNKSVILRFKKHKWYFNHMINKACLF